MFYVYKFLDKEGKALYVGQTVDIDKRMREHKGKQWDLEKDHVEFAECNSCIDMNIYEMYYINKLKAKYNTALVFYDTPSFELPELEWQTYSKDLHEKKQVERDKKFKEELQAKFAPEIFWAKRKETLEEKIERLKNNNECNLVDNDEYNKLKEQIKMCDEKINEK